MTLRQLWQMAAGRREETRELMLGHGWIIGQLFEEHPPSDQQIEHFIRTGIPGKRTVAEPHYPEVDEKVARYWRTGKIVHEES